MHSEQANSTCTSGRTYKKNSATGHQADTEKTRFELNLNIVFPVPSALCSLATAEPLWWCCEALKTSSGVSRHL